MSLGDKVSLYKTPPEDLYRDFGGKLKTCYDGNGILFRSLEEWNAYPYKEAILKQIDELRLFLRTKSSRWWYGTRSEAGMSPGNIVTPIITCCSMDIRILIEYICEGIRGSKINLHMPQSIICTDLGRSLANDFLSIKSHSKLVFCHTFLTYHSLIVNGNKLIGVTNWKYAGYYSVEFDDVIYRYINHGGI
ncbi:hypothetical protein DL89DRAFT_271262, partial [Linderina pennispora]